MATTDSSSFMHLFRASLEALDTRVNEVDRLVATLTQRLNSLEQMKCGSHDKNLEELYASRNDFRIAIEALKQDVATLKAERERLQGMKKDYSLMIWGAVLGLVSAVTSGIAVWLVTKT